MGLGNLYCSAIRFGCNGWTRRIETSREEAGLSALTASAQPIRIIPCGSLLEDYRPSFVPYLSPSRAYAAQKQLLCMIHDANFFPRRLAFLLGSTHRRYVPESS